MKMGQASSQVAQDREFDSDEDPHIPETQPESPKTAKSSKSEAHDSSSKRKRKSSQSDASPVAAASSEQDPKPVKRKKLVEELMTKDGSTPNRKVEKNKQKKKKKSSSPQGTPLKRAHSASLRNNSQMSPSPALSTGDSQTKGRLKRANGTSNARGATGAFQPPEVEALEDFKVRFCNGNGCSLATFDLMVQHGFEGQFPSVNGITKRSFWNQVRAILPNRDKRSVYRFMKRHFQASGQKSHQWTAEQEDELVALYKQHGPKWARIADEIGRSADDVVQRFKNRLEHRDTMNTGPWSDAEFDLMKTALRGAWSRLGEQGYDVGANIYEMDESLISWGQISTSMKHIRSRQQCADKWRGVKTTMTSLPGSQVNSRANSRSVSRSATPSSAQQPKGRRSDAWVRPGDDDSDAPGLEADKEAKNPTPAASSPLKQQNNAESSDGSSSDSEEYSTTSDSEEESESDAKAEKEPPMPTIKKEQETAPSESGSETGSSTNSDSDSDSDDSSSDGSDDEDNPKTVKVEGSDDVIPETPVVEREGASSAMSDASDSSDEESSDSE